MQHLEALGRRLRDLREGAGISRGEAARRAGITTAYWSTTEAAKPNSRTQEPSRPSVPILRAMAEAVEPDPAAMLQLRAELLELAGYETDAALDRSRAVRIRSRNEPAFWLVELQRLDPEVHAQIVSAGRTALDRARQLRQAQHHEDTATSASRGARRNPILEMADPDEVERLTKEAQEQLARLERQQESGDADVDGRPAGR